MKRTVGLLAVMLAATACGSTSAVSLHQGAPSASPAPTVAAVVSPVAGASPIAPPSQNPASPSYAVLVDLATSTQKYTVSLVGIDGSVIGSFTSMQRTPVVTEVGTAIRLPYVSVTSDAIYYLNGPSQLDVWEPRTGSSGVRDLGVKAGTEVGFAVSPDDSTIAVSVLDFNVSPVRVTLYTDSIAGGQKHVIFGSTSDYVWPVAWHGGLLVLAHAYGPFEEDIPKVAPARDNPYSAISYHLVDPSTAVRKVLMGSCTVSGALSPAGSGCIQGGSVDWLGNPTQWSADDWGSASSAAALSPDGEWMAAANPANPSEMGIWRRSDGLMANWTFGPGSRDWAGWIDDQTIVLGTESDVWQTQVVNVIVGGPVHAIPVRGFFAGVFPTNIL